MSLQVVTRLTRLSPVFPGCPPVYSPVPNGLCLGEVLRNSYHGAYLQGIIRRLPPSSNVSAQTPCVLGGWATPVQRLEDRDKGIHGLYIKCSLSPFQLLPHVMVWGFQRHPRECDITNVIDIYRHIVTSSFRNQSLYLPGIFIICPDLVTTDGRELDGKIARSRFCMVRLCRFFFSLLGYRKERIPRETYFLCMCVFLWFCESLPSSA